MVVELRVAKAAVFFKRRFVGEEIVGGDILGVGVAAGVGSGARGKDLTDVIEAAVGHGAVEPDSLHAGFEWVFAEYVSLLSRDDLLHIRLPNGENEVGLNGYFGFCSARSRCC